MPAREIRFRVPRVPPGLYANLLGLAGLIGFAVCIGAITGNWWISGAVGSVFAVVLSWMASTDDVSATDAPAGASGGNVHQLGSKAA